MRKIAETAIDKFIRRRYKPHIAQLGFQKNKGTELALLHAEALRQQGHGCVAILDLKAAYDSVPRNNLVRRIRMVLEKETAEMIVPFLEPSMVQTGHGKEEERFSVDRRVAQGSPLSPNLYNIFMDTFAEALDAVFFESFIFESLQ